MTQRKPIAQQLRDAIARAERRGLTRYRIAKTAGLSERHVKSIAEGDTTPRIDTAERIADAIGARLRLDKGA